MYYRLNPQCKLVSGALRGAIYDFRSGRVYSISSSALKLLSQLQEHQLADVVDAEDRLTMDYLDKLSSQGLGAIFITPPSKDSTNNTNTNEKQLDFLWLEITSSCNNRCLHCYASCTSQPSDNSVSHEQWLSVITQAKQLGASAIQLIGGEPMLYPRWQELVLKAVHEQFEFIEIFTNGTLIKPEHIKFFAENHVSIATTIYADNAEIHDLVTQNPGSFQKTLDAINMLTIARIPLRIASIIMKQNESQIQNIMELCYRVGVEVNMPDVVRPTGRGANTSIVPEHYKKAPISPPFFTDEESFNLAQQYHSCFAGRAAITTQGDVIPCIFAREKVCGNIKQHSLAEIVAANSPLQQCWHTTKDCLTKCKDCEFRYACTDCRPLAQSMSETGDWLACTAGCSYNPYTGKWEESE